MISSRYPDNMAAELLVELLAELLVLAELGKLAVRFAVELGELETLCQPFYQPYQQGWLDIFPTFEAIYPLAHVRGMLGLPWMVKTTGLAKGSSIEELVRRLA